VTPNSATINKPATGSTTLQLSAAVVGTNNPSQSVTWSVATEGLGTTVTVSNAGLVTVTSAAAGGTVNISACSTVAGYTGVCGFSALTINIPAPATVSINAITQFGTIVPVDQNNVLGQIDVVLNVDPGNQSLSKVALLVDGTEVSSQTFSALQWEQYKAKAAAKALAAGEELADAQQQVVLSFNTAGFNATTGMPNCGVASATQPICLNGPHTLSANITTGSSTTPAASVSRTITTRNLSGFVGTLATNGNAAVDPVGYTWKSGALTVSALPVMFGLTAEPFTVTTVAFANIFFGGCNNYTSGIAAQAGGANFLVPAGMGAPVGARFGVPALSGNVWTVTFPNTGQGPGGANSTGDVSGYEFDAFGGGCAAPNSLAIGESPVIIATGSDGNNIALIGGGTGGFLNSPYAAPGAFFPGQVFPDSRFAVRLDNGSARRLEDVGGFVAPATPFLNTNTTSPVIRTNNWVNDALVLNGTALHGGTTRTQAVTRGFENGVSRANAGMPITYNARVKSCAAPGACGSGDIPAQSVTPVTSVTDFPESNAVGGTAVLSMTMVDGLGNTRTNSTSNANSGGAGTETISIDRTNPTLTTTNCTWPNDIITPTGPGSVPCTPDGNIVNTGALTAHSIAFAAIDPPGSGAGVVASGFLSLAGNPLLTQVQRVRPTSSNSWWCPGSASFVSTGTGCGGFATTPVNLNWVTGQRFQGTLTQNFLGMGSAAAYYTVTSSVDDQAGNAAPDAGSRFLYDVTPPVAGGIGFPGFVTGGATTTFSAPVNDDIAVASGVWSLTYGAFADAFQFPAQTTGVTFGGFMTSATVALNTPLMRILQQAPGSCAAPGAIPVAGAPGAIGVTLVANDLANLPSTPQVATVTAGQINTTPAATNYSAVQPGGGTMTAWRVDATTNCAASSVLVSRPLPGVTAANATSRTLTATAKGTVGTFNNPFTSRVDFWVQLPGGTWRFIGSSGSPSVTEPIAGPDAGSRLWTFSVVWTPDAYTAAFAAVPGTYPVNIIAVGVNLAGDALATQPHTGYSVTNP
jgi:hypothetical protein